MTPWLLCIDQLNGGGTYRLNPAQIVYLRRVDGWWQAIDGRSRYHVIASEEDERVEALTGGEP